MSDDRSINFHSWAWRRLHVHQSQSEQPDGIRVTQQNDTFYISHKIPTIVIQYTTNARPLHDCMLICSLAGDPAWFYWLPLTRKFSSHATAKNQSCNSHTIVVLRHFWLGFDWWKNLLWLGATQPTAEREPALVCSCGGTLWFSHLQTPFRVWRP